MSVEDRHSRRRSHLFQAIEVARENGRYNLRRCKRALGLTAATHGGNRDKEPSNELTADVLARHITPRLRNELSRSQSAVTYGERNAGHW